MKFVVGGILVAALACGSGCAIQRPVDAAAPDESAVSAPRIVLPSRPYFPGSVRRVISDGSQWEQLWQALWQNQTPVPALPAVDFTRYQVLFAALGERPRAGHRVSLRLEPSGVEQQRVVVTETSPGPGCMAAAVLSYPVAVLIVPRQSGPYVFTEEKLSTPCETN